MKKHVPHHIYTALMIRDMVDIPDDAVFVLKDAVVSDVLETHNALLSELKQCREALKKAMKP
jgi:hypothetical protein